MDSLEAMDTSTSLEEAVDEIIKSKSIAIDSPWKDYEVLNVALKEGKKDVAHQLLDIGCIVNKDINSLEPCDTPLHNAVKLEDLLLVKKLLDREASVTAANSDANTPLHLAFLLKCYDVVDLLLLHIEQTSSYDDVINKDGISHLHIACARGNAQLVYNYDYVGADIKRAVNKTSQEYPGYTSLQFACDSKSLDTIKVVITAIKLFGHSLKKTEYKDRNFGHSQIETHHTGYREDKKLFLSDFQKACFNGDIEKVKEHIEKGEDLNSRMTEDAIACPLFTSLHFAVEAFKNRQQVVELLVAHGADVTLRNGFCMTPLHCALYSDPLRQSKVTYDKNPVQDDALKIVYEAVEDKQSNLMDPFGLTYFHAAVALNDLDMVEKFIELGQADCKPIIPNSYNFTMYTPLHFAVKYGHEEMAKLLLERGADINANENENYFDTPLQVAIKFGQYKMIDFLLACGANAQIVTYKDSKTTLQLLVDRFGEYEDEKPELLRLVSTLMNHGVDVNAVDSQKSTALRDACWKSDQTAEIIYELLKQGANINALDNDDKIPFDLVGKRYTPKTKVTPEVFLNLYYHVKKLKELGLKLDAKNDEFCEKVMKKKEEWQKSEDWPEIEKMCSEVEQARRRQQWIQEIEKLKVDMLNEKVSLYDYLRMESKDAFEFVINEKIEKFIVDEQFRSVYPVYGYLIPIAYRNSLCGRDSEKPKPLNTKLISSKNEYPVKKFIPPTYRPKKVISSCPSSENRLKSDRKLPVDMSLYDAIKLGNIEWVKELLTKGASINFIDNEKNGPLHLAFVLNHEEIVDLLLSHMKDKSEYTNFPNHQGLTQLHIAASRGNAFVVEKLLEAKADPLDFVRENSTIYPCYSALQFACDAKHLQITRILTKAMKVYGNIAEENEECFAAVSRMSKEADLGQFLFKVLRDKESLSEFHQACLSATSAKDIKRFLFRRNNVNAPMNRNSKNYSLYTALHFAIESSNDRQAKVELLLKNGADVNRKNSLGMTPLHLACYKDTNKDKVHEPLLWRKQRIENKTFQILYNAVKNKEDNPMDAFGLTYFHIAVARNDILLVKKMLFQGEDVNRAVLPNIRDFTNYTPLHFAARYGHDEMAKVLIERGAKVYDEDNNPRFDTPLQIAITYGKCKVINILLDHGANSKVIQPSTKKTTLHLMADRFEETSIETSEGQDEKSDLGWCVEKLVKGGANVDAKDSEGFTALQSCCASLFQCSEMVRWLLYVGADINIKTRRLTALDYANDSWFRNNYLDFFDLFDHVQALKDLGLKVDPNNDKFCESIIKSEKKRKNKDDENCFFSYKYSEEEMAEKKKLRLEEIRILKKDMLTDKVSMYDYIKMNEKQAAAFLDNERLQKIDGIVAAQTLYHFYGYLIPVVYRKSKKWVENQENFENSTVEKQPAGKAQGTKRKLT